MKTLYTLLLVPILAAALEVGAPPLHVSLEGDTGGALDGSAWSSDMLQGKVHILFYVDPDEKETNNDLSEALKAKTFERERFGSVAIVNMAATWLPNFAIAASLESKQKRYPNTLYVKDMHKHLVSEWGLADDSSDVLLFDREGNLRYLHEGKLDEKQIETLISLIEELL